MSVIAIERVLSQTQTYWNTPYTVLQQGANYNKELIITTPTIAMPISVVFVKTRLYDTGTYTNVIMKHVSDLTSFLK